MRYKSKKLKRRGLARNISSYYRGNKVKRLRNAGGYRIKRYITR